MDENKIKPRLLVVGDSFMKPDPAFPGQHWSEMLPEYEVLMFSIDGSSNGIIAQQFYQGLELKPDAVILGFTESNRIEFEYQNRWITGAHAHYLTTEQKLLVDLYKIHVPEEAAMIKDCNLVRGMLSVLEQKQIPYAWTLNLLFNNLSQLPFPSDPWINKILGDFFYRMTPTNLATYQGWKQHPGFHVDDPAWQSCFAQEVNKILQNKLDFCN